MGWVGDEVQHFFKLLARFLGLAIETLGQNHRQQIGIGTHGPPDGGRICPGCAGGEKLVAAQHQRVAHEFNEILMGHGHMPRTQYRDPLSSGLLDRCKFL